MTDKNIIKTGIQTRNTSSIGSTPKTLSNNGNSGWATNINKIISNAPQPSMRPIKEGFSLNTEKKSKSYIK